MRTLIHTLFFVLAACTGGSTTNPGTAAATMPMAPVAAQAPVAVTVAAQQASAKPVIGSIPPVLRAPDGSFDLAPRIDWLINSHPSTVINTDLRRKIESGEVILNIEEPTGGSFMAQFFPAQRRSTGEYIGVIALDPVDVDNVRTQDDALYFMAVLIHEYTHYLQFKADSNKSAWMINKGDPLPEGWCARQWHIERDAYHAEAVLAATWGDIPHLRPLVQSVDSPREFDLTITNTMAHTSLAFERPECVAVWEGISGKVP